jgi:ATP-dependent Clp protease protease subunit
MNYIRSYSPLIKEFELKADPIVIRVNKFDEESATDFAVNMSKAQSTGQNIVPVIIDSYGGQVYALMSMITAIKASKIPVATIVESKAMSCGALLFSFGAHGYRFIAPDATLMIHDVSLGTHGKIEEIKSDAKQGEALNQKVYRMMAANCGREPTYFLDLIHSKGHADWYLDADETLHHGLANHIRVPEMRLTVEVKYKLD